LPVADLAPDDVVLLGLGAIVSAESPAVTFAGSSIVDRSATAVMLATGPRPTPGRWSERHRLHSTSGDP
jgi:hypothetical protein